MPPSSVSTGAPRPRNIEPSAFAQALRDGEGWAERAFVEGQTAHVERILIRVLGARADLDDLVQEVFVRAFQRIGDLRDPRALRSWLHGIVVFVARETIRARRRKWWLRLLAPSDLPEPAAPIASPETRDAVRAFYQVVDALDPDARIAFTLRFVEGMELSEIAAASGVSLATVKRRIKYAEAEFTARARAHDALGDWLEEGSRWPR